MSEEKGYKLDAGKDDWTLLPWEAIRDVVKVLTRNAQPLGKYPRDNWKKVPDARHRYLAALFRHAVDYACGVRVDPEDGLPTIAHVMTCAAFLAWFDKHEEPKDIMEPNNNPPLVQKKGLELTMRNEPDFVKVAIEKISKSTVRKLKKDFKNLRKKIF